MVLQYPVDFPDTPGLDLNGILNALSTQQRLAPLVPYKWTFIDKPRGPYTTYYPCPIDVLGRGSSFHDLFAKRYLASRRNYLDREGNTIPNAQGPWRCRCRMLPDHTRVPTRKRQHSLSNSATLPISRTSRVQPKSLAGALHS